MVIIHKLSIFRANINVEWVMVNGTPTNSDVGTYSWNITASDDYGYSTTYNYTITINENHAPEIVILIN